MSVREELPPAFVGFRPAADYLGVHVMTLRTSLTVATEDRPPRLIAVRVLPRALRIGVNSLQAYRAGQPGVTPELPDTLPDTMTFAQVAQVLSLSHDSVARLHRDGSLPAYRLASQFRVTRDSLEGFVRSLAPSGTPM